MIKIKNAFDSHVHWLATGESQSYLNLKNLKAAEEFSGLHIQPENYRSDWILGFGWDQNNWKDKSFPNFEILNTRFPSTPVVLHRIDGHAIWVNAEAIRRVGGEKVFQIYRDEKTGGRVIHSKDGAMTGVLIDAAKEPMLSVIPKLTSREISYALKRGQEYFNRAGFTHIRDLTCSEEQWDESVKLDNRGEMSIAVEQFFDSNPTDNFSKTLSLAIRAREIKTKNLRVCGIKVFYDGAIGSEGAYLSCKYESSAHRGLRLLDPQILKQVMEETWNSGLELAVHIIGDQAAHEVMMVATEVWKTTKGFLHLEHAELLRPETISLMKEKTLKCHMQPCHWLTDSHFISEKLNKETKSYLFPWHALETAGVSFDFGSDSPIEASSMKNNFLALEESSKHGIKKPSKDFSALHSHENGNWAPDSFTEFEDWTPKKVCFRGKTILQGP